MDTLTLDDCRAFQKRPDINPLTGRTIQRGGTVYLDLLDKCEELKRKHASPLKLQRKHIHDFKPIILSELDTLRQAELAEKNTFKVRAYDTVIKGISLIDYPIVSWEDVKHVKGIGTKIQAKIKEIIRDGQLFRAQELRKEPKQQVLEQLRTVHGIGPTKANQLYREGIRSITQLRKEVKLRPSLLTHAQTIGLQYAEDFSQRIPRKEMTLHEEVIREAVKGSAFHFDLVGSYRRGADSCGDIDVLLRLPINTRDPTDKFLDFIQLLKQSGYLLDTLAEGNKKYMGVAALQGQPARRIDITLTPPEEYAYALLHSTGSDSFNIYVSNEALRQGYSLSEHGLVPVKKGVKSPPVFYTEEELLRFLLGSYIAPEKRSLYYKS